MKRLTIFALVTLLVCAVLTVQASNSLPTKWKHQGKTMPIVLEYEYPSTKGQSYLRGFMHGIADYEKILLDKQQKLKNANIPLEMVPLEQAQMYNELVDLANKGVIGLRIAIFADIVTAIEIKPERLLITFANGKSCTAVGLVYFNEDETDTQIGKALLIKKLAREKPLRVVAYVPSSFKKSFGNYPPEKWVTKITILPETPQTALAEKGE
jgi:hypothetical protein